MRTTTSRSHVHGVQHHFVSLFMNKHILKLLL